MEFKDKFSKPKDTNSTYFRPNSVRFRKLRPKYFDQLNNPVEFNKGPQPSNIGVVPEPPKPNEVQTILINSNRNNSAPSSYGKNGRSRKGKLTDSTTNTNSTDVTGNIEENPNFNSQRSIEMEDVTGNIENVPNFNSNRDIILEDITGDIEDKPNFNSQRNLSFDDVTGDIEDKPNFNSNRGITLEEDVTGDIEENPNFNSQRSIEMEDVTGDVEDKPNFNSQRNLSFDDVTGDIEDKPKFNSQRNLDLDSDNELYKDFLNRVKDLNKGTELGDLTEDVEYNRNIPEEKSVYENPKNINNNRILGSIYDNPIKKDRKIIDLGKI